MKNYINLKTLIVLISIITLNAFAVNDPDSSDCLQITGKIINTSNKLKGSYKVEMLCYNAVVDSKQLKDHEDFKFIFKKNSYYAIRITKKGYQTTVINVYTKFNDNVTGLYKLNLEAKLEKEAENDLTDNGENFPKGILHYSKGKGWIFNEEQSTGPQRIIYSNE